MAGKISGITIEIGGDVSQLTTALNKTDKPLKTMQTSLKDVDRLLKFNPGNTTLLTQKQKLLADSIGKTKERLETLKAAEEQMKGKELTEEETVQFQALQREIVATQGKLENLNKQMDEFGSVTAQKIKHAGDKMEQFGGKVKAAGDKISGAGQALLPLTAAITGVSAAAYKAWEEIDHVLEMMTILENVVYAMNKHADKTQPDTVDEWLEQFEDESALSVPEVFSAVLDIWNHEQETTSEERKKKEQSTGA